MNMKNTTRKSNVWVLLSFIIILSLLIGGCASTATKKVYHVGILSGLSAFSPAVDGFKAEMTQLGYIEGENIIYDLQSVEVDIEAYKSITQKFVDDKVDLIFVFPTEAAAVAKEVTQGTDIPVVFTLSFTDVPGIDLIDSIREPGGNITGVRFPSIEIANKRLQYLLEIAPDAKRIFVPYLKGYPNVPGQLESIRPQAKTARVELIEFAAESPQQLQDEMDKRASLSDTGIDAILMLAEPLGITPPFYTILGKFSYEHKIAIGGAIMNTDGYDTLFGLLPNANVTGTQAAQLADKVLRGAEAGKIPVITSDGYLQVSLKAAKNLGFTIPDGLLRQANEILR
jgi:putative tryptophan/tyrosine transport system substrate-binding protein